MALNDYLFGEMRFVGNELQYEDPRNSCLNEVLDRRTGIPITLALLYMEIARRAGVPVEGVNFPGHFLLRCPARRGLRYAEDLIIDAFHGGALLSRDLLRRRAGAAREHDDGEGHDSTMFESRLLPHATKPQILARMLANLKRVYVRMHSFPQARDITDLLVAVNPSAIDELRDRGLLAYHLKDFSGALRDLQRYLELSSSGRLDEEEREEHERIWEHVKTLRKRVASLN
jgi:regulator of sirC expression with transglutaminase-like and TPR domain